MSSLVIRQSGAVQTVELDGEDISNSVTSLSLDMEAGNLPRVQLDLAVFELETQAGDAQIQIAAGVEDLLKRFGWTPPTEES